MTEPADIIDHYDILGVDRRASVHAIRSRYRRLMQQRGHHPDRGGDAAVAARINKAYAVLSNAARRAEYDASLAAVHAPSHVDVRYRRVLDPARECIFCETPHDLGADAELEATCNVCTSPLAAAGRLRTEPSGQRAVARIDKRLDVRFYTDWRQRRGHSGRTEDLSPNGLCLVARRGLRTGQLIRVVTRIVDAVGTVSHCRARRTGWKTVHVAGVSFRTLRLLQSVGGFVSRRV